MLTLIIGICDVSMYALLEEDYYYLNSRRKSNG